jgi:hypothetical protein
LPEVLGYYRAQCDKADEILAGVSLSDVPRGRHGDDEIASVRVVILHMISRPASRKPSCCGTARTPGTSGTSRSSSTPGGVRDAVPRLATWGSAGS